MLSKLSVFIKGLFSDPRFPRRDRIVLFVLCIMIVSPVDLIPEWIPVFGMMDDIIMIGLIFDYFTHRLGDEIILSHYPFGMFSYARIRGFARIMSRLGPETIARRLWKKSISLN